MEGAPTPTPPLIFGPNILQALPLGVDRGLPSIPGILNRWDLYGDLVRLWDGFECACPDGDCP
jgi:hypothetical protein